LEETDNKRENYSLTSSGKNTIKMLKDASDESDEEERSKSGRSKGQYESRFEEKLRKKGFKRLEETDNKRENYSLTSSGKNTIKMLKDASDESDKEMRPKSGKRGQVESRSQESLREKGFRRLEDSDNERENYSLSYSTKNTRHRKVLEDVSDESDEEFRSKRGKRTGQLESRFEENLREKGSRRLEDSDNERDNRSLSTSWDYHYDREDRRRRRKYKDAVDLPLVQTHMMESPPPFQETTQLEENRGPNVSMQALLKNLNKNLKGRQTSSKTPKVSEVSEAFPASQFSKNPSKSVKKAGDRPIAVQPTPAQPTSAQPGPAQSSPVQPNPAACAYCNCHRANKANSSSRKGKEIVDTDGTVVVKVEDESDETEGH